MVRGFQKFREWLEGHEEGYTVIGGVACDLLMEEVGQSCFSRWGASRLRC